MTFRPSLAMLLKALRPRRAARRPKPAPPRRLEAELLEDRTTPTFISVTVHFINQTPSTLYFLGGSASHGKFTDPHPPDTIAPGGSATWETENRDGSVGTGTEATATYQIGNDPTLTTTLHWDDPFLGDNSFDESAPAGYASSADGP